MTSRNIILAVVTSVAVLFLTQSLTQYLLTQEKVTLNNVFTNPDNTTLAPEENVVTKIVDTVGPAVITVAVENPPRQDDPFIFLFPQEDESITENSPRDIGSGFFVQKDGLVVTNKHVVSDPSYDYFVIDTHDKEYQVTNIYRDPLNDIAILQVENAPSEGFPTVKLGNSDTLKVGQYAVAIGTALGEFRNTVTTGVISGLGRGITAGSPFEGIVERLDNVIQTDAAISSGNSGGPLLNTRGEVIGVNTAVSRQGQNIGFAIPINIVRQSLENFEKTGRFSRAFLGVSYQNISTEDSEEQTIPQGAQVIEVVNDSQAEKSGIRPGDIITKINGEDLTEDKSLAAVVSTKKVGDTVELTIWRNGNTSQITVTLGEAPQN